MRYPSATQSRAALLASTLLLGAADAARVLADYELVDEQSLTNGAQLYEVFCSECHGSDPANQYGQLFAADDPGAADDESLRMAEIARQRESAQLIAVPEEEEWPEWAERPDPGAEQAPDEKTDVMNTLTALIDEAHGIRPRNATGDAGNPAAAQSVEAGPPGGFEPVPGATNLADPSAYFYGTSQEEIFDSIANGTGQAMPGFRTELGSDESIQDVINYIRSFWGEEWLY